MCKLRDRALLRFKKSKYHAHWNYYKNLRNYTKTTIITENLNYSVQQNKKNSWKSFRELNVYSRQAASDIPTAVGNVDDINKYFISSRQAGNVAHEPTVSFLRNNIKPNVASFHFSSVTEDEVYKMLLSIKSKACGSDNISVTMILYCVQSYCLI